MAPLPFPSRQPITSNRGSETAGGLGPPRELMPLLPFLDTLSCPLPVLPSQKPLSPTQLALWMGSSPNSSSPPLGKGGGKYRIDTGHGPLEHLGPTGQH